MVGQVTQGGMLVRKSHPKGGKLVRNFRCKGGKVVRNDNDPRETLGSLLFVRALDHF
jgi:hypothetical protein